jgi:poly(hydroxyalkanoate) depolymerase family esterase
MHCSKRGLASVEQTDLQHAPGKRIRRGVFTSVADLQANTSFHNPKNCFSWFLPDDTARDSGEALSIRQLIAKAVEKFSVDRNRMFVTGLSASGAMGPVMLATYPEIFADGAIIAGLPYGSASSMQEAFEAMFNDRAPSSRALGDHSPQPAERRGAGSSPARGSARDRTR